MVRIEIIGISHFRDFQCSTKETHPGVGSSRNTGSDGLENLERERRKGRLAYKREITREGAKSQTYLGSRSALVSTDGVRGLSSGEG